MHTLALNLYKILLLIAEIALLTDMANRQLFMSNIALIGSFARVNFYLLCLFNFCLLNLFIYVVLGYHIWKKAQSG